jgi:hypothetical protein
VIRETTRIHEAAAAQLRLGRSQRVRSKVSGFGASALIACSAAHPEPNENDRSKAMETKAANGDRGEVVV